MRGKVLCSDRAYALRTSTVASKGGAKHCKAIFGWRIALLVNPKAQEGKASGREKPKSAGESDQMERSTAESPSIARGKPLKWDRTTGGEALPRGRGNSQWRKR
jgi:hypothetical protein